MAETKCYDCDERPATTVRDGERMCAECAAEYDKPVEIHEPTIARVRRDVEQYKCQAAWLDTWALLRMFDRVRADLAERDRDLADARAALANAREGWDKALELVEQTSGLRDALAQTDALLDAETKRRQAAEAEVSRLRAVVEATGEPAVSAGTEEP